MKLSTHIREKTSLLLTLFIVAIASAEFPLLVAPYTSPDFVKNQNAAYYSIIGRAIAQGRNYLSLPERELILNPPLTYFVVAASFALFSSNAEWAARVPSFLAFITSIVVLYFLGRQLNWESSAVVAILTFSLMPLVFYYGTAPQTDVFMLLFMLSASYAFFRWMREGRGQFLLLTGLFVSLSISFKLLGIIVAFPMLLTIIFARKLPAALRSLSFWASTVSIVLTFIYWFLAPCPSELGCPSGRLDPFSPFRPEFWRHDAVPRFLLLGMTPEIIILSSAYIIYAAFKGRKRSEAGFLYMVGWLLVGMLYLATNNDTFVNDYYFLIVAPPFALLASRGVTVLVKIVARSKRSTLRLFQGRILSGLPLLSFLLLLVISNILFVQASIGRPPLWEPAGEKKATQSAAEYLRSNSPKNATIMTLWTHSEIIWYAERQSLYLIGGVDNSSTARSKLENCHCYLVINWEGWTFDIRGGRTVGTMLAEFRNYVIQSNYVEEKAFPDSPNGSTIIYSPR